METRLEALWKALEELAVNPDNRTPEQRKSIQNAIYLAQAGGVRTGYRFEWRSNGPHSAGLAADLHDLNIQPEFPDGPPGKKLRPEVLQALQTVRGIMQEQPDDPGWPQALTVCHFLRNNPRVTEERTRTVLEGLSLLEYRQAAETKLQGMGLIPERRKEPQGTVQEAAP